MSFEIVGTSFVARYRAPINAGSFNPRRASMACPACGFAAPIDGFDCPRCGVVFAHWRGGREAFVRSADDGPAASGALNLDPSTGAGASRPPQCVDRVSEALGLRGDERPGATLPESLQPLAPGATARDPANAIASLNALAASARPSASSLRDRTRALAAALRFAPPAERSLADPAGGVTYFGVSAAGWRALAIGALITAVVFCFPLLRFVTSTMLTLVHETGHALAGWLLGFPSIPAFDFVYGGGVTMRHDRVVLLPILLAGALAYVAYRLRTNRRGRRLAIATLVLHCAIASSRTAQEIMITAAGHGGELLFAAIFLHRALSGRGCRLPVERPLYAFLACFVLASDLGFAWNLATSDEAQRLYADAKGGGHSMDFSRLALELLGTSVPRVATSFMACVLATPLFGWYFEMRRARIERWISEALAIE